jgi:hypothetical protein
MTRRGDVDAGGVVDKVGDKRSHDEEFSSASGYGPCHATEGGGEPGRSL